jgi:murein DD-endopeptidase MepM/ murein hydrolase activator NlpD
VLNVEKLIGGASNFWRCSFRPAGRGLLLILVCLLYTFTAAARETTYVVKSKDTLTDIARRHGVSVAALAARNGLGRNETIYIGQRLAIPTQSTRSTTSQLSTSVQQSIATAPVKARRWRNIVIHHAAVDEGTLQALDRYHREQRHMENGLAYHFLIGNGNGLGDGVIGVGNRWKKQLDGGHLRSEAQNRTAIGICLIGNFDESKPTEKQMQSLEALTRALMKRCQLPVSVVKTHKQINVVSTRCPGRYFPTRDFLNRLK